MKHKKKKMKVSARHRLLTFIWFLQVIAEVMALLCVRQLDMLPGRYFLILAGAFALLALWSAALMLPKRTGRLQAGFGTFLSVVVFAVSCAAALVVMDARGTIQGIAGHTGSNLTMAVYVRAEDSAESIADAGDYRFAVVRGYDEERTVEAVASIEAKIGHGIDVTEYAAAQELVDAFFSGDVDALIINSAYVNLLEGMEGYEDFHDRVRVIYTVRATLSSILENMGNFFQNKNENITRESFVIYISGSDTRDVNLSTSRSDVNILAVVNPQTRQMLLVNTPRDYFIPNPASSSGAKDKLTHCGIYGIECSMQALSELYGVDVDYYAQINFAGFETLIDAMGGVTVYSDVAFTTGQGISFTEGENYLNGAQALAFARERKHLPGGDNARGQNQMKMIRAVIDKMTSGTTILTNYSGIMGSLEGMFATSMTADEISDLVKMQLKDMSRWNIISYAVTGYDGSDITYSMPGTSLYVMYPNETMVSHGAQLIDRVIAGEILTEADMVAPE